MTTRTPSHPVADQFPGRWSPRAFTGEPIPDEVLFSAFEAARWAPSAFNLQPWRFLHAKREDAHWATFLGLLAPFNQVWAARAAALILVVSQTSLVWEGKEIPAGSHSFDAGAAWSAFAHQAHLLGWATHAMGGFDREAARRELAVPEKFALQAMIAIGRQGDPALLPEKLREREFPSDRRPLAETIFAGAFPAA